MSPKRYELVHSFLHVVDNNSRNTTSRKLFKVKPLEEMIPGKTKQIKPKNICQKNKSEASKTLLGLANLAGRVMKLKNLSDVHSILLGAVENDFQLVIQKESYEIASDL